MVGNRRKEKPRLFLADVYNDGHRLVANASVELWTRNHRSWRGQMLFPAESGLSAGACYTLKATRKTRPVRVIDVQIIRGMSWVLFEQVAAEEET